MSGPSWRDRLRPIELVGMAGILGLFAGVVGLVGSRSIDLALIFAGVAFILGLLVLAMLALAAGDAPHGDEEGPVLDRQPRPRRSRRDRS